MGHNYSAEFLEVWEAFPRKTGGKLTAALAYARAIKAGATHMEIMAGIERYKDSRPQFLCHVSTFLNQGRYEDEYPPASPFPRAASGNGNGAGRQLWDVCQHEPPCRGLTEHDRRTEGEA